nr:MAG: hypothetical protein DIU58_14135 [Sphaerobacter thermophilus]
MREDGPHPLTPSPNVGRGGMSCLMRHASSVMCHPRSSPPPRLGQGSGVRGTVRPPLNSTAATWAAVDWEVT